MMTAIITYVKDMNIYVVIMKKLYYNIVMYDLQQKLKIVMEITYGKYIKPTL